MLLFSLEAAESSPPPPPPYVHTVHTHLRETVLEGGERRTYVVVEGKITECWRCLISRAENAGNSREETHTHLGEPTKTTSS